MHIPAPGRTGAPSPPLARPAWLLRLEGAAVLALAIALYWHAGGSWLLFALLLLAPDLSMLGYLVGPRLGAACYNLIHSYVLPLLLFAYGWFTDGSPATWLALIWLAHIGMDRSIGYGLKYATAFKDTHLQRV